MRLIGLDELPPPGDGEPADPRCFRFSPRRNRDRSTYWVVHLVTERERRATSERWLYELEPFPTKAAAREWARAHAVQEGYPYREYVQQEQTAEQLRGELVARGRESVLRADEWAEKADDEGRLREAAERWIYAARRCEEQFAAEPGSVPHLRMCAVSRINMALDCLRRWRLEVSTAPDAAGLQKLPGLLVGLPGPKSAPGSEG